MFEAYMKTLIKNGGGAWHVIRIAAETEEGINLKRDMYLAKSWGDATAEEFEAQLSEVANRANEVAEQDADDTREDVEKEVSTEEPVAEQEAGTDEAQAEGTEETADEPVASEEAEA